MQHLRKTGGGVMIMANQVLETSHLPSSVLRASVSLWLLRPPFSLHTIPILELTSPSSQRKQPLSFHALAGTHFAAPLFSNSCRKGGCVHPTLGWKCRRERIGDARPPPSTCREWLRRNPPQISSRWVRRPRSRRLC